MTTAGTRAAEAAEAMLAHQSAVIAMVKYAEFRDLAKRYTADRDAAGIPIRRWLDQHIGQSLKDGETGWCAELVTKEGSGDFDWQTIPPDALVAMARAGCFKSEGMAALEKIGNKNRAVGDLIKKHRMPGGQQQSLSVTNKP